MDDTLRWPGARRIEQEQPDADIPRRTSATARTGGDGDDEPVMIARVSGQIQIEMAQAALKDAGIPSYVKRASVGIVYGFNVGSLGSAEIYVPHPLAEQATDVLIGIGVLEG